MATATRKAVFMGKLQEVQLNRYASYTISIPWADLWTFASNGINDTNCLSGRARCRCRDVLPKRSFPDVKISFRHIPRSKMRHVMRSNYTIGHSCSPYRKDKNWDKILRAVRHWTIAVRCHQTPKLPLDFQGALCFVLVRNRLKHCWNPNHDQS